MSLIRISAGEATQRSAKAASWLRSKGLQTGDRIVAPASNAAEFLYLVVGALRSGIIPVVINQSLPTRERDDIASDCDPSLVVRSVDEIDWSYRPIDIADVPLGRPMLYTSGTTGKPKGVWSGVFSETLAKAFAEDELELWQPDREVHICTPLYHSASLRIAIAAMNAGATIGIHTQKFDPVRVAHALNEFGAGTFLVPTQLKRMLALEEPFTTSNRILLAGEPAPVSLKRKALGLIPNLWEFYGSTEGQFTMISPQEWLEHPGSVGKARTNRTLHLEDIGADGVGTVYVTAPGFAKWEYFNDPERTARAWSGHAFTVGDLGRIDSDCYLYLTSRREDLIITGGVNVYPAMVEAAIAEHPDVHEVAVFGVEDEQWGQRVCAAIVACSDMSAFINERLSGPMRPKQIIAVDALPRTPTGKIDRQSLREEIDTVRRNPPV